MDQDSLAQDETTPFETPEAKARRLGREWEMIEEARRELDAGLGISGTELEKWLKDFENFEPEQQATAHEG